uniref:Serine/threonine-protein kinase PLK1 n=1 Tax=Denticeps clupeoides TaxID=299321 RepID=A0AAY4C6C4_9TELE
MATPASHPEPRSAPLKEVPDVLLDTRAKKRYLRGRFLGKGGFAKCYEITDVDTKEVFAGKVVSKSLLLKPHQKEKMSTEIAIHRSLDNPHVVGFRGFFEDDDFVFVVLEICRRRSLLELHKRRKAVTEPEARYFMRQTILGCMYLHNNRVIHRDLKLGNLFLSDDMEVKIGDFGLATKIEFDGERKKTLCGTPNYIAPEVLCKKGHSFEVDIWSLGCILYTLLVGKPPFETSCLKETYGRIKKNEYSIPRHISPAAASLIRRMLHAEPSLRPSISDLLADEFFTSGYAPLRLPTSCLTVPPRFSIAPSSLESLRRPLSALNKGTESPIEKTGKAELKEEPQTREPVDTGDSLLAEMLQQLTSLNAAKPSERAVIRQGTYPHSQSAWSERLCAPVPPFTSLSASQRKPRTPPASPSSGSASGWTTRTSTAWDTSCVTTAWASCSTTPPVSSCTTTGTACSTSTATLPSPTSACARTRPRSPRRCAPPRPPARSPAPSSLSLPPADHPAEVLQELHERAPAEGRRQHHAARRGRAGPPALPAPLVPHQERHRAAPQQRHRADQLLPGGRGTFIQSHSVSSYRDSPPPETLRAKCPAQGHDGSKWGLNLGLLVHSK